MGKATVWGCLAAALVCADAATCHAASGDWRSRAIGAPPSQPLASPDLYGSGNECGVDRPEPEWDRNYKFLGYACVRNSPGR